MVQAYCQGNDAKYVLSTVMGKLACQENSPTVAMQQRIFTTVTVTQSGHIRSSSINDSQEALSLLLLWGFACDDQVDSSQVTISSSWKPILQSAVTAAARALDINDSAACSIEARLHKLLLYEQGGHFSAHQDTEKERGMIGTLVVQLPYVEGHSGGSLTVRHKGRQFIHNFAQVASPDRLPVFWHHAGVGL